MQFEDVDLAAQLDAADAATLDALGFGVVAMDEKGTVIHYNRFESQLSGIQASRVIGQHFFTAVAPCTNNYLVAQRFEDDSPLDSVIDYVFTLKMRPTRVKLRLLKSTGTKRHYLLVARAPVVAT